MTSYRPRTPPVSSISSARPLTPPSSSVDGADNSPDEKVQHKDEYVPHIFDLVGPSRDAAALTTLHIPAAFLQAEAVDSSVLLGHGASFSASLQRIPEGPQRIETTTHNEGWSVTKSVPAPPRPKYVVYKVARVAFQENGEPFPEYHRALQSVLTEYHALIYPPLFHHVNIINFLGVAWGSNPFSPAHKLPAIVVEYAEHGTLADLLRKNRMLDFPIKHVLCLDVVRGLAALHGAGLVHGDVKAENVLVCSNPGRKFVAKIADFGFSIIQATETAKVWLGGTNPWRAPETKNAIEVKFLKHTDTYSLGLLIWLVCVDGRVPFDFLIPTTTQGAARSAEIEELKRSDKLLAAATTKGWLMPWLYTKYDTELNGLLKTASMNIAARQTSSGAGLERAVITLRDGLYQQFYAQTCQHKLMKRLDDIFTHSLQVDPTYRELDAIVDLLESDEDRPASVPGGSGVSEEDQSSDQNIKYIVTNNSGTMKSFKMTSEQPKEAAETQSSNLPAKTPSTSQPASHEGGDQNETKVQPVAEMGDASRSQITDQDPPKRSLKGASAEDDASKPTDRSNQSDIVSKTQSLSKLPSWTTQGYKHRWISWQKMRTLEPSEQNLLFDSFSGSSGPELFVLCSFLMNGYGCKTDVTEALKKLSQAAGKGHHLSRAYMYRIYSACDVHSETNTRPGQEFLSDYAIAGSRVAFEELEKLGPVEKVEQTKRLLTDACGGVGASWFDKSEMLHGYTQSQWIKDAWLMEQVKEIDDLSGYVVNRRGDSVLHFVAACGRWKPFKSLIVDYKMDINIVNPQGETPLLCCCRSGQGGIAIMCLQSYKANASIAAKNGETPLHWLISFEDQYVQPLANDLIANGAKVDATTHERISHSKFPANIDVDFQMPGTALGWAVHHNRPQIVKVLLGHGADPNWTHAKGEMSPLKWAAYYHHDQCLKAMIEHLEGKVTDVTSDGKIDKRKAFIFGPVLSEAIHASDKFSMILRNGSDYLNCLHATLDLLRRKTEYINTQSTFNGNMLYFAVSEAHDEVVEYMFDHSWRLETLNDPCVPAQRTPLLEAIRWNRRPLVERLLNHGAEPRALAANPFQPELLNWSALHVFAQEGHNKDVSLVQTLLEKGVPVDGPTSPVPTEGEHNTKADISLEISGLSIDDKSTPLLACETPFAVAIRHNAFHLASTLLTHGANPNALSLSSGLFKSPHPLNILGHIIISNARYSSARLKYLLRLPSPHTIDFIVEPARQLSALHRAAMAHQDTASTITGEAVKMREFDLETNTDILYELLLRWPASESLDKPCGIRGNTALHLAVEAGNAGAVESLRKAGAGVMVQNEDGETAVELAERVRGMSKAHEEIALRLSRGGRSEE